MARFIKDVSIDEGSIIAPNTPFVKTWRFQNSGSLPWPDGVALIYIGKPGGQMSGPNTVPLVIPNNGVVQPSTTIDISVNLVAPNRPGRYTGYWRLFDPKSGSSFGSRTWVQITVPSSSASNSPNDNRKDNKRKHKQDKKTKDKRVKTELSSPNQPTATSTSCIDIEDEDEDEEWEKK